MSDSVEDEAAEAAGESMHRLLDSLRAEDARLSLSELAGMDPETRAGFERKLSELSELRSKNEVLALRLQEVTAIGRPVSIMRADLEARQLAGRLLPRGARDSCFEPYYQDLLSRFVQDVGRCDEVAQMDRRRRRFASEVRGALALTWWALAKDASTRSIRWIAVAVLGDGAVRVVYWAFTELLRRL
jgi:hypothetical protein